MPTHSPRYSLFLQTIFLTLVFLFFLPHETLSKSTPTLDQAIQYILKRNGIQENQVSIRIASLGSGKILYDKNPLKLMNPASNVKLVTSSSALYNLGPQFHFSTEFYSDTRLHRGAIRNLWIKGYGDPFLVTEEMEKIVNTLYEKGLRVVEGNIFADDSYFDQKNKISYRFTQDSKLHEIVTGALSFNFNSIRFWLSPAKNEGAQPTITLEPPVSFAEVLNEARTTSPRSLLEIESEVEFEPKSQLRVHGQLPKRYRQFSMNQVILDPALYTATIIKDFLKARGIKVLGNIERKQVPSRATVLYEHDSSPLTEILIGLNKFSNNFTAEQLIKVMGAKKYAPPGSTEKGLQVIRDYMTHLGIHPASYTITNGSGLSKDNRLSAAQIVRVLETSYRYLSANDFISSLSIAGVDGTLKRRFTKSPLKKIVLAKTGSLAFVNCLSGYLMIDRVPVVFSILINDYSASLKSVQRAQEKILLSVYTRASTLPLQGSP